MYLNESQAVRERLQSAKSKRLVFKWFKSQETSSLFFTKWLHFVKKYMNFVYFVCMKIMSRVWWPSKNYGTMVVRTPGNPGKLGIHLEFENFTWKKLENLEFAGKMLKKHLEFEIFQINFDKILTRLLDFRKVKRIDQRLPFWRASVKSTWNVTIYIEFWTLKSCIFHLENLEFSFDKSWLPWQCRPDFRISPPCPTCPTFHQSFQFVLLLSYFWKFFLHILDPGFTWWGP